MKAYRALTSLTRVTIKKSQPEVPTAQAKLKEGRRRLPINIASNLIWLVLNAVESIWYAPYLIAHLGVAVYGLVPLAGSVTSYMTVVTQGFNSAVSRFLTIDLAKGDTDAANRTFNTAVVSSLVIAAVLFPVALALSWLAPWIFDVPMGYDSDARWLVLLVTGAFLLNTLSTSFSISSYAYHRFDLRLLLNVFRMAARVGFIVLVFTALSPRLWQVGAAIFVSAFLFLLGHRALNRRLTPELTVRFGLFEASLLRDMLGFSGWILVNHVGSLLFLNIDLIVANLIFGAEMAGRYGAVLVLPSALRRVVGTVQSVLVPIVLALYAQARFPKLVRFSCLLVRFVGLSVALPVGLLCGLGEPLLTTWLGPEFADLHGLVVVLVGHLCINVAVVPLFSLQVATKRVRIPGIVTLIMGVINAVLAVALALWSDWGYISIAIAGAVVLTVKNAVFTPLYGAHILKLPWWTFLPSMAVGVVACAAVGAGTYWASQTWILVGWGRLALVAMVTSAVYAVAAYFLGLSGDDRALLLSEIRHRLKIRSS